MSRRNEAPLRAQRESCKKKRGGGRVRRVYGIDSVNHIPGDIGLLRGKSAVLGVDAPLRALSSTHR